MCPLHGHFFDFHPEFASQEEKFGIESPALDALQREDGVGGTAGEGFEPALRVAVGQTEEDAQGQVEDASKSWRCRDWRWV